MNIKKILSGVLIAAAMLMSVSQVKAQVPYLTLNNGVQMPQFGIGTVAEGWIDNAVNFWRSQY